MKVALVAAALALPVHAQAPAFRIGEQRGPLCVAGG